MPRVAHCAAVLSIGLEDILCQGYYSSETANGNFSQVFLNADVGNHAENTKGEEYLGSDFSDELCEVFHQAHSPLSYFPSMNRLAIAPRVTRMAVEAAATNTLRVIYHPSILHSQDAPRSQPTCWTEP